MVDRDDGRTDETATEAPRTLKGITPERAGPDPAFEQTALPTPSGTSARLGALPRANDESRYQLGERLGQGGMGEVVLAYDDQIGREVAVKRIRAADPTAEELARFVREARVQGRLQHPAVAPVHDLAVDRDGRPFFVMKRLAGTTMDALVATLATLAPAEQRALRQRLLRAFVDVCLAVEFAHAKGIVHRDLKPSNIMLGDFGEVYVLDWGIARAAAETDELSSATPPPRMGLELETGETRAGTVLGTPAYMAPEQLVGDRATAAADAYALGCILYELVAGEALHRGRRTLVTAVAATDARPSRVRADAPPELDTICERATRIDPDGRPTARAIGDAVQAYLDGDRDLAKRKELALAHLAAARAAIARGDDAECRREAMLEAGRALALDPTASEAAELVTHLVLRPPEKIPEQVEETLAQIDTETARAQGKLAALSMIGYLGFVPLLLWTGVREPGFVVAFAVLSIASALHVWLMTRRDRIEGARIYLSAVIHAVLLGLICRMVGPFIIAPTLVFTTLMAYAAHPRFGRIAIVAAILASSIIVPWALELAGVLSRTYEFVDGAIVLHSPILVFRSAPVQLAFAVLLVVLVAVVAVLSRAMAERQRDASRRVELQAWQLRQLVPSTRHTS